MNVLRGTPLPVFGGADVTAPRIQPCSGQAQRSRTVRAVGTQIAGARRLARTPNSAPVSTAHRPTEPNAVGGPPLPPVAGWRVSGNVGAMTVWMTHNVEEHVREVLAAVAEGVPGHHFDPPFVTAYHLAIALDRQYPEVREALAHELGGEGTATATALRNTSPESCPDGSISIPATLLRAACSRMPT